jgi:hypothetical protein
MLFRKSSGELIEIKKYDFPNDKLYYEKIMEIKKPIIKQFVVLSKSTDYFTKKI